MQLEVFQSIHSPVNYLHILFERMLEVGASDIHFEPKNQELKIRYRVQGLLRYYDSVSLLLGQAIIARLKMSANLDISTHHLPQDGRMQLNAGGKSVSCRVSSCPCLWGEKWVCRILSDESTMRLLNQLGFSISQRQQLDAVLSLRSGLIVVIGATGSGKTTTLYALMQQLAEPEVNVVSLEDPIEVPLSEMTQISIRPEQGLDFSVAFRGVLRQDPDVIMVGELRDQASAQLAVQAALTGHLVLTTVHAGSAEEVVHRLKHLGVEDMDLNCVLRLVVAQHWVKNLVGDRMVNFKLTLFNQDKA